jgi:hypothetical protein
MLPLSTAAVLKGVVCKLSIVEMVLEDTDAMLLGEVLERAFGFYHFLGGELGHEVNVIELQVVVDKDGGRCIAFLGECPL